MEKLKSVVVPQKVLERAGITDEVKFVVRNRMVILIPKSFTQLTKGLVKPFISIEELHEEYDSYLLERGLGVA